LINYRANIKALQMAGTEQIIATAAVGSLNVDFKPGMIILPNQFLDFTKARRQTFYEGGDQGVVHCDMTVPYCGNLRAVITQAGKACGVETVDGGTYVCTEGPRFETRAEIKMFKQLGGDVIGMTGLPEVALSRELGMCYANISMVTNFAAGISPTPLTHTEVLSAMKDSLADLRRLLVESIERFERIQPCNCADIIREQGMKG
jgi:5'-methylthioadenosine phosphorylase